MSEFITYLHLLTPLHTGGSADEGNLMGIAKEVHTEFPYLPASSIRGRIRAELESSSDLNIANQAVTFFGKKIKEGQQPTEGEVWFADAALIFFPIASLSHHLIWVTCPLWLERWNRWLNHKELNGMIKTCRNQLQSNKSAVVTFSSEKLYLQTALLREDELEALNKNPITNVLKSAIADDGILGELPKKLVVLTEEDCAALVETGLQREVRVTLEETSKTVKRGSFRSEEAIPPEAVLFFPWGMKPPKESDNTDKVRESLPKVLNDKLQFGGLEGLGRGWVDLKTVELKKGG